MSIKESLKIKEKLMLTSFQNKDYEKAKQNRAAGNILNTVSTPEDIADGILTMATASKTTGHTLVVDAGDTLGPRIVQGLK